MVFLAVFWIALYGVVAVTVAVATFLAADRMREPGGPAPDNTVGFAVLAGLLWPVTVMGAAQVGMLVAIQHPHRSAVTHGSSRDGALGGLGGFCTTPPSVR